METTYWFKQGSSGPLFPDLLWSRPENRRTRGKLLIVGGNDHGFAAVAQAYSEAQKAGIGTVRALLPDALQKTIQPFIPDALFAPSTPSGSFARAALATIVDEVNWADGVLFAGDLGRNSETAVMLENVLEKTDGQITLTQDAFNYALHAPDLALKRQHTLLVGNIGQLQKLLQATKTTIPITFDMGLLKLVDTLHHFTKDHEVTLLTKYEKDLVVARKGDVSSTKTHLDDEDFWRVRVAAHAAVWWLQNPTKPFEAITTSLLSETTESRENS